tara:strand:- start:2102 stop:2344 length:243 start_codon:yes stop_codon:yes gene_type:complete
MKLKKLMEEMGAIGMSKIRDALKKAIMKAGKTKIKWNIKEGKPSGFFMVYREGKPFARVPHSQVMNTEYLADVLRGKLRS